MTEQELDKKFEEALRRVELKIEINYMMWLIKTTGVMPIDSTRPGDLLYSLPILNLTPDKLVMEDRLWRLRLYQNELMNHGMYVDFKLPVVDIPAL